MSTGVAYYNTDDEFVYIKNLDAGFLDCDSIDEGKIEAYTAPTTTLAPTGTTSRLAQPETLKVQFSSLYADAYSTNR